MKNESITTAVEEHYAAVARGEAASCSAPLDHVARSIGYSDEELALWPAMPISASDAAILWPSLKLFPA